MRDKGHRGWYGLCEGVGEQEVRIESCRLKNG